MLLKSDKIFKTISSVLTDEILTNKVTKAFVVAIMKARIS